MLEGYAQAFFLHIPKTAGKSFQRVLREAVGEENVRPIPHGPRMDRALRNGPSALVVYGHVPYAAVEWLREPLFVMTFLREPVDRAISAYEWILRRKDGHPLAHSAYERWQRRGVDGPARVAPNLQTTMLGGRGNLKIAKERLATMQFVGITERFEESVRALGVTTGVRENVAPQHGSYDRDEIAEANALDVELYEFALSLDRFPSSAI